MELKNDLVILLNQILKIEFIRKQLKINGNYGMDHRSMK